MLRGRLNGKFYFVAAVLAILVVFVWYGIYFLNANEILMEDAPMDSRTKALFTVVMCLVAASWTVSLAVMIRQMLIGCAFTINENGIHDTLSFVMILAFIFVVPVKSIPFSAVVGISDETGILTAEIDKSKLKIPKVAAILCRKEYHFMNGLTSAKQENIRETMEAFGSENMKTFCFTVDDNIRFLKEICEKGYESIFDHPYTAILKGLHDEYKLKVQLNLFYRDEEFDLSMMTDRYAAEWEENSHWLKMSFHSEYENVKPYEFSGYDEVFAHCKAVNSEIKRFASEKSLAETATVHYCVTTDEGVNALFDNGVKGLLGLFGSEEEPMISYNLSETDAKEVRNGKIFKDGKMSYGGIDIVMNNYSKAENLLLLSSLSERKHINVMIHEQYFYPDYPHYQADFREKIGSVFSCLRGMGYRSVFFEDLI